MPQISVKTLQYVISALADEIRELQQTIDDGEGVPEDFERFENLERAADELQEQYDEEAKTVVNLTPYDKLVGR